MKSLRSYLLFTICGLILIKTGEPFVPQVFAGETISGCMTYAQYRTGQLSDTLRCIRKHDSQLQTRLSDYFAETQNGGSAQVATRFNSQFKVVSSVSSSFDLPIEYVSCLFFIESKWDENARPPKIPSKKNEKPKPRALGISQLNEEGFAQVIKTITRPLLSEEEKKRYLAKVADLGEQLRRKKNEWNNGAVEDSDKVENEIIDLRLRLKEVQVNLVNDAINSNLQNSYKHFCSLNATTCRKIGSNPKKLSASMRSDPSISILFGALFYKYTLMHLDFYSFSYHDGDFTSDIGRDLLFLGAGAYNWSISKMASACGDFTYSECLDGANNVERPIFPGETRGQIKKMQNCVDAVEIKETPCLD